MLLFGLCVWSIFHYIFNSTLKYSTKGVYGMCADAFVSFKPCYLCGANMKFFDQSILRNSF